MDSILNSVKKMLGVEADYDHFDPDILMAINSTFTVLCQIGVGPDTEFSISGPETTWSDFFAQCDKPINLVKSYIYLKTKLLFDPPTTGVLHEAMERQIQEFEWRLNVADENYELNNPNVEIEGDDEDEIF